MTKSAKTIELKFERTIPASAKEAYLAWLNPKTPGTPWNMADKLIFNPKVNGLWYWLISGNKHYGRFTELTRSKRIRLTWMSRYTLGEESLVTVSFKKKGNDTLMTLLHSGLPKHKMAYAHKDGWNQFMDLFLKQF